MLTGVRPPEASDILNEGFPLYQLQQLGISENIQSCVVKAMMPIKKDRFQTVNEMVRALAKDTKKKNVPPSPKPVHVPSPASHQATRHLKVLPSTTKVTFEYFGGVRNVPKPYFASVDKFTTWHNITLQDSVIPMGEKRFQTFLYSLHALGIHVKEEQPSNASTDSGTLHIRLYDGTKMYMHLWIDPTGGGNIDGKAEEVELQVRQIVPDLQEYLESPAYKRPDYQAYWERQTRLQKAAKAEKEALAKRSQGDKRQQQNESHSTIGDGCTSRLLWAVTMIIMVCIFSVWKCNDATGALDGLFSNVQYEYIGTTGTLEHQWGDICYFKAYNRKTHLYGVVTQTYQDIQSMSRYRGKGDVYMEITYDSLYIDTHVNLGNNWYASFDIYGWKNGHLYNNYGKEVPIPDKKQPQK